MCQIPSNAITKALNPDPLDDYSAGMVRWVSLAFAAAFTLGQESPDLGFRVGSTFRTRRHAEARFTYRAAGVDEEGTMLHLEIDADLGWKIAKAAGTLFECEVVPKSYRIDFKDRQQLLELKNDKFSAQLEENAPAIVGLTKPFSLMVAESGKIEKTTLTDGASPMIAKFLLDVLPSDGGALLGWFGPLPKNPVAGREWITTTKGMLAREDFFTITATCSWVPNDRMIKARFRAGGGKWPKEALEESDGSVTFDAKGRISSVKVSWSARTKEGELVGSFKSQTDFLE